MKRSDLPIPTPCAQDWDTMTPAGRKRFCGECKKHVHDLSSMLPEDARALLSSPPTEGLCVRYLYDEHGTIVFSMTDTTVVPANMLHRAKRALTATAAIAGVAATLTGCMGAPQVRQPPPQHMREMMGEPAWTPAPSATTPHALPSAPVEAPGAPTVPNAGDHGKSVETNPKK